MVKWVARTLGRIVVVVLDSRWKALQVPRDFVVCVVAIVVAAVEVLMFVSWLSS
jgi:hypothetical protein